jgi:hypothetical protein
MYCPAASCSSCPCKTPGPATNTNNIMGGCFCTSEVLYVQHEKTTYQHLTPFVVHMYSAGSGRLVMFDMLALVRPKQFEQDAYLSVPPRVVVGNQPSHRRTTYIIFESVSPLCHALSHASYITVTSKPSFRSSYAGSPVQSSAMVGPKRSLHKLSRQSSLLFH